MRDGETKLQARAIGRRRGSHGEFHRWAEGHGGGGEERERSAGGYASYGRVERIGEVSRHASSCSGEPHRQLCAKTCEGDVEGGHRRRSGRLLPVALFTTKPPIFFARFLIISCSNLINYKNKSCSPI